MSADRVSCFVVRLHSFLLLGSSVCSGPARRAKNRGTAITINRMYAVARLPAAGGIRRRVGSVALLPCNAGIIDGARRVDAGCGDPRTGRPFSDPLASDRRHCVARGGDYGSRADRLLLPFGSSRCRNTLTSVHSFGLRADRKKLALKSHECGDSGGGGNERVAVRFGGRGKRLGKKREGCEVSFVRRGNLFWNVRFSLGELSLQRRLFRMATHRCDW